MEKLEALLDKHIQNAREKFNDLPRSQEHDGFLGDLQNYLEDTQTRLKGVQEILTPEYEEMMDYFDEHLADNYTEEQVQEWGKLIKAKFYGLTQEVLYNR